MTTASLVQAGMATTAPAAAKPNTVSAPVPASASAVAAPTAAASPPSPSSASGKPQWTTPSDTDSRHSVGRQSQCLGMRCDEHEDNSERSKKRRITRACDLCNKRRVKCDGQMPCSRCAGSDVCEYARAVYKRGKPSRAALLERKSNGSNNKNGCIEKSDGSLSSDGNNSSSQRRPSRLSVDLQSPPQTRQEQQQRMAPRSSGIGIGIGIGMESGRASGGSGSDNGISQSFGQEHGSNNISLAGAMHGVHTHGSRPSIDRSMTAFPSTMTLDANFWDPAYAVPEKMPIKPDMDGFGGSRYSLDARTLNGTGSISSTTSIVRPYGQSLGMAVQQQQPQPQQPTPRDEHMRIGFLNNTGTTANDDAIDTGSETLSGGPQYLKSLKYPVLRPVMPYIVSFLSEAQAASLLELYFSSPFNTFMHPPCKHVHAFMFRKISVMSKENPRKCSPALLASMLWAAAETGGAETPFFSHSKRTNICRRLRILTVQLLRPLVHVDVGCSHAIGETNENAAAAAFSHRKMSESQLENFFTGSTQSSGTLDDVITYIHLAAITSASEEKAMSMRWWHAAFALARELRLNKEPISKSSESTIPGVSPTANNQSMIEFESDPWFGLNSFNFDNGLAQFMDPDLDAAENIMPAPSHPELDQEHLEERRRAWWLLYIQDRHLALCYNRQNALLDAECEDLLLPLDEASWQSGSFLYDPAVLTRRPSFPSFECTGHNVYGWFLPLMTIVGTILDYNHNKNHHTLGRVYADPQQSQLIESQILSHLDTYTQSLAQFESSYTPAHPTAQDTHHTQTVIAYAKLVVDVSRVLVAGKWDPVSLFDDRDMFMATPSFTTTIANAISAADHVSHILDVDPDLSFVPYFLGIQLLQGSLPLLLIVDRLQTETDPKIIAACEVIIRATEACVSTLDTEYQRNYRQIMRSAVTQARGRYVPPKETQFRRHTVLALYRWTKNGTGIAL